MESARLWYTAMVVGAWSVRAGSISKASSAWLLEDHPIANSVTKRYAFHLLSLRRLAMAETRSTLRFSDGLPSHAAVLGCVVLLQ